MADVYISEYPENVKNSVGQEIENAPLEPALATHKLNITTALQTPVFQAKTKFVEVIGDGAFHMAIGDGAIATTADKKIPADTPLRYGVKAGNRLGIIQP